MKPGPRSLHDFCEWPHAALRHLLQTEDGSRGERFERLKLNLQRGLLMYSDYSGLAGEHECMFGIRKALQMYEPLAEHASAVQFCRHAGQSFVSLMKNSFLVRSLIYKARYVS